MKPAVRQLRDMVRPRVSLPSVSPAAGPGALEQRRSPMSEALLLAANKLNLSNEFVLSDFQRKLVKRTTAVVTDALLGPGASPSLRLLVRRALRAAVAIASSGTFLVKLCVLVTSLDHLDFAHDIKADAELASAVDSLLCPAVPPTLLVRFTLFMISIFSYWLNFSATTDSLCHLHTEHLDVLSGAESVLDLAVGVPGLMESAMELLKIRASLGAVCDPERVGGLAGSGGGRAEDR